MAAETQKTTVVEVRSLSPSVRELVLAVEEPVAFQPGQWLSLHLPIGQKPPLVRAYSMAQPPSPPGQLVLAFDRVPGGLGSGYLWNIVEGDTLMLAGRYGTFLAPDPLMQELLLIARYTGIVPIRCILTALFAAPPSWKVTLIYGAPNREELIYHDEFVALASRHQSFRYETILLQGEGPVGDDTRPELERVVSLFGSRKDFFPMVCGVKAFVHPLRSYFKERGFGRREARYETYD